MTDTEISILKILKDHILLMPRPDYEETEAWMVKPRCLEECAVKIAGLKGQSSEIERLTAKHDDLRKVAAIMEKTILDDAKEKAELTAEAAKSLAYAQARNGEIENLLDENEKLTAERDAWKILAKANDKWNALPQTDKEAALQKALEDTTAENEKHIAERDQLRAAFVEILEAHNYREVLEIARRALAEGTGEYKTLLRAR